MTSPIDDAALASRATELFDIRGRRAAVTGGASGLGLAMARILARFGAEVTIIDVREDALAAARAELAAQGLEVATHAADVADLDSVTAAMRAAARGGSLHIAFVNAGISAGNGPFVEEGRLASLDLARWRQVLDVNLTGVLHSMRAAAGEMRDGYGRIVVTSSSAGVSADALVGYAYAASKTAVLALVRNSAFELAPRGILVNAIAPGPFRTGLGVPSPLRERKMSAMLDATILHRMAEPGEMEGIALYLASPASSFVTGAVFSIDGGAAITRHGRLLEES